MGWCGNRILGSLAADSLAAIATSNEHQPIDDDRALGEGGRALRIARRFAEAVDVIVTCLYSFMLTRPKATRGLVVAALIVAVAVGFHQPAQSDTLLNTLNDGLRNDTATFFTGSFFVANSIFGVVGTIIVLITLAEYLTEHKTVAGMGRVFLKIILMIMIPWAILQMAQLVLPGWYNTALNLGTTITGQNIAPNPDGVFATGADLARQMLTVVGQKLYNDAIHQGLNVVAAMTDLLLLLVAIVAAMILFVSFTLLAVEILVAFAQGYISIAVGAYQLGWSAAKATSGYAAAYWGLVMAAFSRIFITMAIIGVGLIEAHKWIAQIQAMGVVTDVNGFATNILTMLQIPLLGVAFLFLTTKVTDHAMAHLSGRPAYAGGAGVQGGIGGSVQGAISGGASGGPAGAIAGGATGGMRGAMSGSHAGRGAQVAR